MFRVWGRTGAEGEGVYLVFSVQGLGLRVQCLAIGFRV